jgi:DNA polymerase III delta subunit
MKSFVLVSGPRDAGPGEREVMLQRATAVLEQLEVDDVTRIDVPGKGSGDEQSDAGLRLPVQALIPALQSGSLFGDRVGVLVVDAQNLLKPEAEIISEVLGVADESAVAAVFVAAGTVPLPLGKTLKALAEQVSVKRLTEKSAQDWLTAAAREKHVRLGDGAVDALIKTFGTDVGSLGRALDQLAVDHDVITGVEVADRFKNRPDEPVWMYGDAVSRGSVGDALRRLEDFLHHDHPLVLLAYLNNDLRRRALAAAAPDYETFVARDGGRPGYALEKVWKARNRTKGEDLRRAVDALARADIALKSQPEATHRVLLERLTVALCRWYGGSRR